MVNEQKMKFRKIDGFWRRIDSKEEYPPTLAEILNTLNIVIDDDAQFCQIIRYYADMKETITYIAYNGQITIKRWQNHIQL